MQVTWRTSSENDFRFGPAWKTVTWLVSNWWSSITQLMNFSEVYLNTGSQKYRNSPNKAGHSLLVGANNTTGSTLMQAIIIRQALGTFATSHPEAQLVPVYPGTARQVWQSYLTPVQLDTNTGAMLPALK
jgi:hypothetical protein